MGRSDCDNAGLVAFKDRWGAARTDLSISDILLSHSHSAAEASQSRISKYVWSHAPSGVLAAAGRALYRHMG